MAPAEPTSWSEVNDNGDKDSEDIQYSKLRTVNLANKKAAEMRANQRVKMIEPDVDDEKETKRDNLKIEIVYTYDKFIKEHCNYKGEIVQDNGKEVKNPAKVLNEIF